MTLTEALSRASGMHNLGGGRRKIIGQYPDGSVVEVERDERNDHRLIGLAYAVTIRSPLVGEDTRVVTGPEGIKSHLKTRRLPVADADWTIERGHIQ